MYAGTLRKLRVAGAFLDSSSAAVPTTPTPKKTRKTATDDDEDSPKKKRGRPAKTAAEKFVGKKDTLSKWYQCRCRKQVTQLLRADFNG